MKIGNKECVEKSTVRTCNVATQVRRHFASEGGRDIKHLLKMKIFKLLQIRVAKTSVHKLGRTSARTS